MPFSITQPSEPNASVNDNIVLKASLAPVIAPSFHSLLLNFLRASPMSLTVAPRLEMESIAIPIYDFEVVSTFLLNKKPCFLVSSYVPVSLTVTPSLLNNANWLQSTAVIAPKAPSPGDVISQFSSQVPLLPSFLRDTSENVLVASAMPFRVSPNPFIASTPSFALPCFIDILETLPIEA